jgi:DNA-binding MarR family transcriptional regulator
MSRRTSKSADVRGVMDGLRKIVRGLRLSARAAERTAGISGAQLFVLQSLSEEAASSLNELAERTFTDQSSVSVVVRRLVEQGLVDRRPSANDGRRVELRLTSAGRKLARKCPEPTQAKLVAALRGLGAAELAALRAGIGALVDGLGKEILFTRRGEEEKRDLGDL